MPVLVLPIGCVGSGKSTFVAENFNNGNPLRIATIVCPDKIRVRENGSKHNQSRPNYIFGIAHQEMCDALRRGENVVMDATNISSFHRANLIKTAREAGATQVWGIWIDASLETCLQRNRQRPYEDRVIDESVIHRMHEELQWVEAHGFDKLYYIDNN